MCTVHSKYYTLSFSFLTLWFMLLITACHAIPARTVYSKKYEQIDVWNMSL